MKLPTDYNHWRQLLYRAVGLPRKNYSRTVRADDNLRRDTSVSSETHAEATTETIASSSSTSPVLHIDHFAIINGITGESFQRSTENIQKCHDRNGKVRQEKMRGNRSAVLVLLTPIQHRVTHEATNSKNNNIENSIISKDNQFKLQYNPVITGKTSDVDNCPVYSDSRYRPFTLTTDLYMTLTMRSSELRTHAAEISFPGGKCDKSQKQKQNENFGGNIFGGEIWETAQETASRETEEEIGLGNHLYDIIGELPAIWSTPSKNWVTPVVALAKEAVHNSGEMVDNGDMSCGFFSDPSVPSLPITPTVSAIASDILTSTGNAAGMPYRLDGYRLSAMKPVPYDVVHIASPREVKSIHYLRLGPLIQPTTTPETHHRILKYYDAGYVTQTAHRGHYTDTGKLSELMIKSNTHTADSAKLSQANIKHIPFVMPCFFASNISFFQQRLQEVFECEKNDIHFTSMDKAGIGKEEHHKLQLYFPIPIKQCESKSPATLSKEYLKLIKESDVEQSSVVWGLTAFIICDLIARVTEAHLRSSLENEICKSLCLSTGGSNCTKKDTLSDTITNSMNTSTHQDAALGNVTILSPSELLISDAKFPCGIPGLVKYVTEDGREMLTDNSA